MNKTVFELWVTRWVDTPFPKIPDQTISPYLVFKTSPPLFANPYFSFFSSFINPFYRFFFLSFLEQSRTFT